MIVTNNPTITLTWRDLRRLAEREYFWAGSSLENEASQGFDSLSCLSILFGLQTDSVCQIMLYIRK